MYTSSLFPAAVQVVRHDVDVVQVAENTRLEIEECVVKIATTLPIHNILKQDTNDVYIREGDGRSISHRTILLIW